MAFPKGAKSRKIVAPDRAWRRDDALDIGGQLRLRPDYARDAECTQTAGFARAEEVGPPDIGLGQHLRTGPAAGQELDVHRLKHVGDVGVVVDDRDFVIRGGALASDDPIRPPPITTTHMETNRSVSRRDQKMATGLVGLPVPRGTRSGSAMNRNS